MADEFKDKASKKWDGAKDVVATEKNPWDQETKLRELNEQKLKTKEELGFSTKDKSKIDVDDWDADEEDPHQDKFKYKKLALEKGM